MGSFALDAEVGRNIVTGGENGWSTGFVVSHACAHEVECLVEVHESIFPGEVQTLLNLGARWRFSKSLGLLMSAGHDFGPRTPDRQTLLAYLALQVRL